MSHAFNYSPENIPENTVKAELLRSMEKSQVMLVYVCSLILFSWTIFDYFLFPLQYKHFFVVRSFFSMIPPLVCYFRNILRLNATQCTFVTTIIISILDGYILNTINIHQFRTFALAHIIFFIGVGMLAVWEIYYSLMLVTINIVVNAILFYLLSPILLKSYLLDGQIAIFTVAVFSVLLINIRYKLVFNELRSRMALELSYQTIQQQRDSLSKYANQMEHLVQERTAELSDKSEKIIEQKNFYDAIFSNIPIEISIFNEKHEYLFANKMCIPNDDLRGLIIGKDDRRYCNLIGLDDEKSSRRQKYFQESIASKKSVDFEDLFTGELGEIQYKQFGFFPIYHGEVLQFMIFYANDITVKKKYEIHIEDSLKEKEALLGEVHHRVKNNLALITGLIEFQKIKITDEAAIKEFDEIKHRISSMALIHETLYKSTNFASVDLSQCLKDLILGLKNFYGRSKDVKLYMDNMEKILVPTKTAIPIALMVNEMITNSYKHAFKESSSGEIKTTLCKQGDNLELVISDNGKGLHNTVDPQQSKSLGMRLISIFVKQIKGNVTFNNQHGLTITVVAPIE